MDKLVAQYSRPSHQNEFYTEEEQHDLTGSLPPLSLKFALPPVANVSLCVRSECCTFNVQIFMNWNIFDAYMKLGCALVVLWSERTLCLIIDVSSVGLLSSC